MAARQEPLLKMARQMAAVQEQLLISLPSGFERLGLPVSSSPDLNKGKGAGILRPDSNYILSDCSISRIIVAKRTQRHVEAVLIR